MTVNKKFIVSIGDEGAILTCVDGKNMYKRLFASSHTSEEFMRTISSSPEIPIYVLVDTVDQSYIRHAVPPVNKGNANKLALKKLSKGSSPDDIKTSICLGKHVIDGQNKWDFLLISVKNSPPLSDWIDALGALPNKLEGIYLLPLESEDYFEKIFSKTQSMTNANAHWSLLISHNRTGGFRQLVFKDGTLVFTRIIQPVGGASPDVVAGNIEQEVLNTIEYIRRLGFDDADGLNIYIIVADEIKQNLEIGSSNEMHTVILTPHKVAEILNVSSAASETDRFGDIVFATFFAAQKKHKLKIHTKDTKNALILESVAKYIKYLSVLAGVAMLAFAGYCLFSAYDISGKVGKEREGLTALKKNIAKINKLLDIDEVSDKKTVLETIRAHKAVGLEDNNLLFDFLSKYNSINGFATRVENLSFAVKDKNKSKSIDVDLNIIIYSSSGEGVAFLLDEYTAFYKVLSTTFADYKIVVKNPPDADVNNLQLNKDSQEIKFFSVNVKISGPNNKRGR